MSTEKDSTGQGIDERDPGDTATPEPGGTPPPSLPVEPPASE